MTLPHARSVLRALAVRARPYVLPLVVSSALGALAIHRILADAGRPALPLDDSFIHLVYARRFAEWQPFTFAPGGGFSSGATSFLWPLLLAPFQLIGLHGITAIWGSWALGTLLHAATALETKRLVEPIAGRGIAVGAAAMCLLFGAFAWFAWSGMETMALAWAMVRTVRVASEYIESPAADRTVRRALGLSAIGAACPLFRPEGGLFALVAAGVLVALPAQLARDHRRSVGRVLARLPALAPLVAVGVQPLLNLAFTGHARSTTAIAKWAIGNPYYEGDRLWSYVGGTIRMLVSDLLSGGRFTAIFIPENAHWVLAAGLACCLPAALRAKRVPRAALGLLLALATLIPCTFLTILWNRVRYIYPFAPGWFFLVACLASEISAVVARVHAACHGDGETRRRDTAFVGPLLMGLCAGMLATKLDWALADLANSSYAIDRQQVHLGEWARENLPQDAVIGVNDTGAIAYLSERRTFDVVGLTTETEARYYVAGAGSRYEHYERLPASDLPTHFIVYPEWMACPPVLGERLTEATVTDQSILGGATKVAYRARYEVLGRASSPTSLPGETPLMDEVDVSDLESEASHRYWLGGASDTENRVTTSWSNDGLEIADGGRGKRAMDWFVVNLPQGQSSRMVARLSAEAPTRLSVSVGGARVGTLDLPASSWEEVELTLPADTGGPGRVIEIRALPPGEGEAPVRFGSLHYWFFEI